MTFTTVHMDPPTPSQITAAWWLVIAVCLIAVIEGVTITILIAAKRKARRAVPAELRVREYPQPAEVTS